MVSLYNIRRNTDYGIYKFIPDIDWDCIAHNVQKINTKTVEKINNALIDYLNGARTPSNSLNGFIDCRLGINYHYVSKMLIKENHIVELDRMIDKMRNFTGRYIGADRVNNSCTWSATIPAILANDYMNNIITQSMCKNYIDIIYSNATDDVNDKLITFYNTAMCTDAIKVDDHTYQWRNVEQNIIVLFLTGTYTADELDKILFDSMNFNNAEYLPNFCSKKRDSEEKSSHKINQIRRILEVSNLQAYYKDLADTEKKLSRFAEEYMATLELKNSIAEKLKQGIIDTLDIQNLINTLDKMSNVAYYVDTCNNELIFTITTSLFNYDEGVIRRMFEKGLMDRKFTEDTKWVSKVLKDCFVNNTKEFMTETSIRYDVVKHRVMKHRDYDYCLRGYVRDHIREVTRCFNSTFLPNPHIARYNCWGQNLETIVDLSKARKWEELLYCIQASLANINFNDVVVFEYFLELIKTAPSTYKMCKDVATGELLTVEQLKKGVCWKWSE